MFPVKNKKPNTDVQQKLNVQTMAKSPHHKNIKYMFGFKYNKYENFPSIPLEVVARDEKLNLKIWI